MDYNDRSVKICEHPIGKIVQDCWDKYLTFFGYDKDVSVYDIKKRHYDFICKEIDARVSGWFEPFRTYGAGGYIFPPTRCNEKFDNLLNAWNYRARHLPKKLWRKT